MIECPKCGAPGTPDPEDPICYVIEHEPSCPGWYRKRPRRQLKHRAPPTKAPSPNPEESEP